MIDFPPRLVADRQPGAVGRKTVVVVAARGEAGIHKLGIPPAAGSRYSLRRS